MGFVYYVHGMGWSSWLDFSRDGAATLFMEKLPIAGLIAAGVQKLNGNGDHATRALATTLNSTITVAATAVGSLGGPAGAAAGAIIGSQCGISLESKVAESIDDKQVAGDVGETGWKRRLVDGTLGAVTGGLAGGAAQAGKEVGKQIVKSGLKQAATAVAQSVPHATLGQVASSAIRASPVGQQATAKSDISSILGPGTDQLDPSKEEEPAKPEVGNDKDKLKLDVILVVSEIQNAAIRSLEERVRVHDGEYPFASARQVFSRSLDRLQPIRTGAGFNTALAQFQHAYAMWGWTRKDGGEDFLAAVMREAPTNRFAMLPGSILGGGFYNGNVGFTKEEVKSIKNALRQRVAACEQLWQTAVEVMKPEYATKVTK